MKTEMWICEGAEVGMLELRLWLSALFFCIQAALLGIFYPDINASEN